MSPLLKAIGVGVGVFAIMMVVFWVVTRLMGKEFLPMPGRAPTPAPTVRPSPQLPFLQ